jgi:hypothetical protein
MPLRQKRAAERDALLAKRNAEAGDEAVTMTAAEIQTDQFEKMMNLLDRIHRRVASLADTA